MESVRSLASTTLKPSPRASIATIPFSFHASKAFLPSRRQPVRWIEHQTIMSPEPETGRAIFINAGMNESASKHSATIVFHRYGSEYFLAEVWSPYGLGSNMPVTKREKELKLGPRLTEAAVVTIALRAD